MSELSHNLPASPREKLIWTTLLVLVASAGFLYVDLQNAATAGHGRALLPLETSFDGHIPFVPEFVFGYMLYYPWVLLPLLVLPTRELFYRALSAFGLTQLFAQTIFVLFPSHIARPSADGPGLAVTLLRLVYRVDSGWNLFPSLHVAHTLLVALLISKHARFGVAIGVWLGTLLIWASTVLVKQHFLMDIPGGVLLGCFGYALTRRPLPRPRPLGQRDQAQ